MKILVIYGGNSLEREYSLKTSLDIVQALKLSIHIVDMFDYNGDGHKLYKKISSCNPDVIYNTLHGNENEGGRLQGFFDILQIPYIGSGVLGSALARNKYITKLTLKGAGFDVPKGILIGNEMKSHVNQLLRDNQMEFPLTVKPNSQDSRIGFSMVYDEAQMMDAIDVILSYDKGVLIEEYIKGEAFAISIVKNSDNDLKTVVRIEGIERQNNQFLYRNKANMERGMYEIIDGVFELFDMKSFARLDIVKKSGKYYILEISSLPDMSRQSILPNSFDYNKVQYSNLVEMLLRSVHRA